MQYLYQYKCISKKFNFQIKFVKKNLEINNNKHNRFTFYNFRITA